MLLFKSEINKKEEPVEQKSQPISYKFSHPEEQIRMDIAEDDDYYYIYADMTGKRISDIKLKFKGADLSLRVVEDEDEDIFEGKDIILQERLHEECERIIKFEEQVDKKKVDARLEEGLLSITVKKIDPEESEDEDLISIMG